MESMQKDNSVKDSMSSLPQPLLAKSALTPRPFRSLLSSKDWQKQVLPMVQQDQIRYKLGQLDLCKSIGLDRMHLKVLGRWLDVILGTFSIMFEKLR